MSSQHPRISVIVPSYNYGHYIDETLRCLQEQTFSHWEALVIDDGSTDDTCERVASWVSKDPRVRYFYQQHCGPSAARNMGLKNCGGEYIQFLDADDLLESQKFERQLEYLDGHPGTDIVYGDVRYFRNEKPHERSLSWDGGNHDWTVQAHGAGERVLTALLKSNITAIHTPLTRKTLLERVGLFDEEMRAVEDWDFWLRCAAPGGNFHYQHWPQTVALVRSHSTSSSRNRVAMLEAQLHMRRKVQSLLNQDVVIQLNNELTTRAEDQLRLEKALLQTGLVRRLRAVFKAGQQSRSFGLRHALLIFVARSTALRLLILKLRKLRHG